MLSGFELFSRWCPWKIKEFTIAAATHFNEQVSRDLANIGLASPTPSVLSVSSRASKLSEAGERLHNTKMAVAKAALMEKQTELKRERSVEIEIKRLEMEMNQKQFELKQQLELAKLEADRDISKAKEKAEYKWLSLKLNLQKPFVKCDPPQEFDAKGEGTLTTRLHDTLSVP